MPAGLGLTCFSGKFGLTGFPVNLAKVLNGEHVFAKSTFITGAGVGGLGTPSWSSSEASSGRKVVPDSVVRVEVEEEGAGLGGRKKVELLEVRN